MEELELVMKAESPQEAQVVAALLRAVSIPVYVDGRELLDEFAMSRATLGLAKTDIYVRASDLEEARRAIADARGE